MTLEQAKTLTYGQHVHHVSVTNADGTPQRFKVTGKVKTWKTRPSEVRVPIKRGMYEHGYLDHHNISEFNLGYGS